MDQPTYYEETPAPIEVHPPKSGMSKKAAIAGAAISAVAASDDWKTQAFIAAIALVAVVVQAVLDWQKVNKAS